MEKEKIEGKSGSRKEIVQMERELKPERSGKGKEQ